MAVPVAVVAGNVSGNIGQCVVNTTSVDVSSFYKHSFAVNSCTGQIVGDYTYYDWSYVFFPSVVIICIFALIVGMKWLVD